MQIATKQLWASALAAIAGSLCCVVPLILITLGISGAWISRLTALEPYRPIFIGMMLVFLGLAFRQLYVVPARCAPGELCANPRLQRRQRQVFWGVFVGLERVPGVTATAVDFDKKTATVTFDADKASTARLIQATTNAGFPSKLMPKP